MRFTLLLMLSRGTLTHGQCNYDQTTQKLISLVFQQMALCLKSFENHLMSPLILLTCPPTIQCLSSWIPILIPFLLILAPPHKSGGHQYHPSSIKINLLQHQAPFPKMNLISSNPKMLAFLVKFSNLNTK